MRGLVIYTRTLPGIAGGNTAWEDQASSMAGGIDPAYLNLARRGTLKRRAAEALDLLGNCRCCPRHCQVNRRLDQRGVCGIGRRARVASYFPHMGEEDCLRGWRGSGTVFFSGCNLHCVFCQNDDISQGNDGRDLLPERLAEMMLELQAAGCHNINWVTPTHVVPQAMEALAIAADCGLRLPIVFNTGGYDSLDTLRLLDGVVDLYMPDFKFWDPEVAAGLAHAPDYPAVARAAIREMHRQVGDLVFDNHGIARRGLLIRHLILPDDLAGTGKVTTWLAQEISRDTFVNLMGQYHPAGEPFRNSDPERYAKLSRPITQRELRHAFELAHEAGLHRFDQRRPA